MVSEGLTEARQTSTGTQAKRYLLSSASRERQLLVQNSSLHVIGRRKLNLGCLIHDRRIRTVINFYFATFLNATLGIAKVVLFGPTVWTSPRSANLQLSNSEHSLKTH